MVSFKLIGFVILPVSFSFQFFQPYFLENKNNIKGYKTKT